MVVFLFEFSVLSNTEEIIESLVELDIKEDLPVCHYMADLINKDLNKPKKDRVKRVIPASEFNFYPVKLTCICPSGEKLSLIGLRDDEYGKYIYSHRMSVVESVFANIGIPKQFNHFSLRGKIKVDYQWKLYYMVHNIEKLAKYGNITA